MAGAPRDEGATAFTSVHCYRARVSGYGSRLDLVHVTMPFGVQRSTLMTVAQRITDVIEADGGSTGAVLSGNRGLTFNARAVRYVDFTRVCPREWFTRRELAVDVLSGSLGRNRPYYGQLMGPAIDAVAELRPRVVLVYAGHYAAASLPRWERVRADTEVVLYVHNPLSRTYGRRELRRLLDHADRVVFAAEHLRSATEKRVGRADDRLVSAPNGVDPFFLQGPERMRSPETFEVVFAGRVWPNKGVHLMLEAVQRAATLTSRPLRARVIGNSDYGSASTLSAYERRLREMASTMSVPVEFESFVDHATLRDHFRGAAAACLPSLSAEARPLAALEAMATGLPVVTSDLPGMKEAVGAAGIVIPRGDPRGMAGALAAMADDEGAWIRRSRAAREFAKDNGWGPVAKTLISSPAQR